MANNANLYGTPDAGGDPTSKGTAKIDKERMGEGEKSNIDPVAALYWREVERYNRATSDWKTDGEQIEEIYLDDNRTASSNTRKFALLWANVQTLQPAVYTKVPTVLCSRRFKDRDPVARVAAELIERASNTTFDLYHFDEVFRLVRDDRLLPGRGQAWVRYEAQIAEIEEEKITVDPATGEQAVEMTTREKLISEKACADYVHWKDFGHNVSGVWKDVWLVWRVVYKTHDEVAERFGDDQANRLTYNAKAPAHGSGSANDDPDSRCRLYELWDRNRGQVAWMAEGQKQFLEVGPPPLKLADFFPCPEPCYATKTSKSLIPKADYAYYRDQAKEINDLTEKIHRLSQWLIVKGFIPGGPSSESDPIEEVLRDKGNKELFVTVDSMQQWSEKGGAAKLIDWLPLEKVAITLQAAINARNQLIQDVFQLTGLSDILRGQTDPNETLGAQELKAQTGNRRLRNTKDEIARFTKDISRLVAEVIADKFEPKSIADITGFKYQPAPEMIQPAMMPGMHPGMMGGQQQLAAMMGHNGGPAMDDSSADPFGGENLTFDDRHMALLRDDRLRSFRIDIETDSTIMADENAEKQRRVEFIGATGSYLDQVTKVLPVAPDLAGAMGELLMFTARGFRVGRNVEETLERGFAQMAKRLRAQQQAAAQQPKVDPAVEEAKANIQLKTQEAAADHQLAVQKQTTDAQLEVRKQNIDASLAQRKQTLDAHHGSLHNSVAAPAQAKDVSQRMLARLKPSSMVQ